MSARPSAGSGQAPSARCFATARKQVGPHRPEHSATSFPPERPQWRRLSRLSFLHPRGILRGALITGRCVRRRVGMIAITLLGFAMALQLVATPGVHAQEGVPDPPDNVVVTASCTSTYVGVSLTLSFGTNTPGREGSDKRRRSAMCTSAHCVGSTGLSREVSSRAGSTGFGLRSRTPPAPAHGPVRCPTRLDADPPGSC